MKKIHFGNIIYQNFFRFSFHLEGESIEYLKKITLRHGINTQYPAACFRNE